MVRFFATDLDGTFLRPTHSPLAELGVSEVNLAALARAREVGVGVAFATGRAAFWVQHLRRLADLVPFAVVSNGAAVLDMAAGEYVHTDPIDPALALDVVADLRAAFPDVAFAVEVGQEIVLEGSYVNPRAHLVPAAPVEEALARGEVLKVIVQRQGLQSPAFAAAAVPVIGDRLTTTYSWLGEIAHLELSAAGVSKATGLTALCGRLGVEAGDVAAFGDMPNDVEMLRWAGHPHVMPDSHPDLLASGLPILPGPADEAVGRRILEILAER